MSNIIRGSTVLAAFMTATLLCGPATAQDLSAKISCLKGKIAANDSAELGQSLQETDWDSKGGVTLLSDLGGVKLRVLDNNGVSVCQETANNTTACLFRVDLTSVDMFNIQVDNAENGSETGYTICAY